LLHSVKRILSRSIILPIVEDVIREFLSETFDLEETVVHAKDFDVDGCLLKFKKPEVVLEVKWGQKVNTKEIFRNLKRVNAKKYLLFVPDKRKIGVENEDLEIVDMFDFI
jgi:hypothetical protein